MPMQYEEETSAPILETNTLYGIEERHTLSPSPVLFRFWFGVYGSTVLYVWEDRDSPDDALETAAAYLADHAPGIFSPPEYSTAAIEIGAPPDWEDRDDSEDWADRISEAAEVDHTYTESGYLLSWEWGFDQIPEDSATYRIIRGRTLAILRAEYGDETEDKS
jgi:hypothetical protein